MHKPLYILLLLLIGCRPVSLFRDKSHTTQDGAQVSRYDSLALESIVEQSKLITETIRDYKPGRDSIIIRDGKPIVIQTGSQVIREIIREVSDKKTEESRQTNVSGTDSTWWKVIEALNVKDKETKAVMPVWGWAIIAGLTGFILKNYMPNGNRKQQHP